MFFQHCPYSSEYIQKLSVLECIIVIFNLKVIVIQSQYNIPTVIYTPLKEKKNIHVHFTFNFSSYFNWENIKIWLF